MNYSFEEIPNGSPPPSRRTVPDPQEIMAFVMAQHLRDGEIVGTGAGSAAARAACRLAQLTHAPSLTYLSGGSGAVNSLNEPLAASSCDYTNLICEAVLPVAEVIEATTRGAFDVFFYGGLQVDKFGNVNLSRLGSGDLPGLRGPGSAGLPGFGAVGRGIVVMNEHTPRSFVEKVDFRTAPGFLDGAVSWQAAKEAGLITGNGPALVVSPLAVLDFEPESKAMRLVSVHPNVSVEQVQAATGFALILPDSVPTTALPDIAVLQTLREMDENRLLRITQ